MFRRIMLMTVLMTVVLSALSAPPTKKKAAPKRTLTQNVAEFASQNAVTLPRAIEGVRIPSEASFKDTNFSATALEKELASELDRRVKTVPVKDLIRDRELCRQALALDAIRTAGAANLDELAASDPKYAAFMKVFLNDADFMRLYAGAELIPQNSAVGFRVMADIWARDGKSSDFDKRLCAGIAACWGAGPQSERLQRAEQLSRGDGQRSDPVWRYFFFRQSEKAGVLHPNYAHLRPWEIRFIAGNSWDDESLWYLQHRILLPWDQYGSACWAAKYTGASVFGDTIQGPLFSVQTPRWMGSGESTIVHGGVCGGLSHVGAHAAAARGIPAYTVGQPGHCAYGFRLKRGEWKGGFGGPDGGPHNWIFEGKAPTMTRLMEDAFKDDRLVDHAVLLRAFGRAGSQEAYAQAARVWPHNYNLQREYLQKLKDDGQSVVPHLRVITPAYAKHGFALNALTKPFAQEIEGGLTPERRVKWFLSSHRAIANTPPSWAENDIKPILKEQLQGMDEKTEAEFVGQLFRLYMGGKNDQVLGQLLEWAIENYVAKGRDQVFADAFASVTQSTVADGQVKKGAMKDKNAARKIFAQAIVAAENAKSPIAVNALTDLAEKQGLADGSDPNLKIALPAHEKLISDQGLLSISTTSGWDSPIDHRNVLRPAPGRFHTDKETTNWALVDLGKTYPISTVMVVKNTGNEWRSRHLRVSRSVDGATFFPIDESYDTPNIWTVPGEDQPARWIKVERISDDPEFFHLRNILIFTKEK